MRLKVGAVFSSCREEGKCLFLYRRISCFGFQQGSTDVVHRTLVSIFFTEQYGAKGSVVDGEV